MEVGEREPLALSYSPSLFPAGARELRTMHYLPVSKVPFLIFKKEGEVGGEWEGVLFEARWEGK